MNKITKNKKFNDKHKKILDKHEMRCYTINTRPVGLLFSGGIIMKSVNKAAIILAKILEVLHWFTTAIMVVVLIASAASANWLEEILQKGSETLGNSLTTYGYEMNVLYSDGKVNMTAILLFSICAVIILSLMAMVFRNVNLILKTTLGQTKFSKGQTPFQKDNTRMVREIGIFFIAVTIVSLIMSIISRAVLGVENAEISVNLQSIITGIIVLCLSQSFAYGIELQKQSDETL